MSRLCRESDIPLYRQIADDITQKVNIGELKVGDKIASETDLSEFYEVSRMTVRQALNDLLRERVLVRKRGFGTFVAEHSVERTFHPDRVTGFFDEFSNDNAVLKSVVTENALITPPKAIAQLMGISETTPVCKLTRVRILDNQPIVVDESYLDQSLWEYLDGTDFSEISLFEYLLEVIGERPESSNVSVRASAVPQNMAAHLKVSSGAPILNVEMVNKYSDGRVLQVGRLYCPEWLGIKFAIGR